MCEMVLETPAIIRVRVNFDFLFAAVLKQNDQVFHIFRLFEGNIFTLVTPF